MAARPAGGGEAGERDVRAASGGEAGERGVRAASGGEAGERGVRAASGGEAPERDVRSAAYSGAPDRDVRSAGHGEAPDRDARAQGSGKPGQRAHRRAGDDPDALVDAALSGDRRALARILTAVENRTALAEHALRRLYPRAGAAHLVGITGPPGSGKSTVVSALIGALRAAGRPVAVVAVDPSSPITGGALLGDRVRMQQYATDRDVFIRSMASRGHAGGLASTSTAAAAVLDAAGFDVILLETVGTGQSEVEVAAAADTTVVLEAPEMGDEVQAIKAGLLEVADIVVVNKGDRPGAQRTASQLRSMLVAVGRVGVRQTGHTRTAPSAAEIAAAERPRPKEPEVLVTTATTGEGIPELLAMLDRHRARSRDARDTPARLARAEAQVWAILADRLRADLHAPAHAAATEATIRQVAAHDLDPFSAADRLLRELG
ncbi:MAG TPA: methylmalonyl Co-A mutase-associated GTPase MeaB [Candidatus Binatia bacterium]|nr:methylmalonyl Co-A mutase-associated GTPase MeaB [Candidatus Binatia bacterium]